MLAACVPAVSVPSYFLNPLFHSHDHIRHYWTDPTDTKFTETLWKQVGQEREQPLLGIRESIVISGVSPTYLYVHTCVCKEMQILEVLQLPSFSGEDCIAIW